MYILIDRANLVALYKHPKLPVLDNLRHIECPFSCVIADYENGNFGSLTDLELRVLYRNMCGQSFYGYHREHLEDALKAICKTIPDSQIDEAEVVLQAMSIPDDDDAYYRYAFGSATPSVQNVLFRAIPLCSAPQVVPYTPRAINAPSAQYIALQTEYAYQKALKQVPKQREPRESSPSTYVPPAGGSKTGRVWEIAEPIYQAAPDKTNWKEIRKAVVDACVAEGINSSTASVQYGKWKKTKE